MNWLEALRSALGLGPVGLEETRSRTRLRCDLPIKVNIGGKVIGGHSVNINSRGITAYLNQGVKRGQTADVSLISPSQRYTPSPPPPVDPNEDDVDFAPIHEHPENSLRIPARVIWTRRSVDGLPMAGFEFGELSGDTLGNVLNFLRQELAVSVLDDSNKRRFRRITTRWPADYTLATLEWRDAIVKDISPCGCLLLSRFPLLEYTSLTLHVRPDSAGQPIALGAMVRRCLRRPGEDWWEIACPIVEVSDVDRNRLQTAIETFLKRRRSHAD